ncbi:MAG: exodeoxyribonuclease V subunit gamma [Simkaniaceae bacterium]|nr:MAG: exodeoxyribonuclease V subunit gamma [Simkaniaceae bacterium]
MRKKPIVTLSNSNQTLSQLLRDRLFLTAQKPFEKKIIFLPDLSLKNSLMTTFVSDGKLDVVMGIEFVELGSGLQTLFKLCTEKTLLFPPLDLLTLQLESLIDTPGLAPKLAIEFLRYGKYGGPFLKKWPESWQKELWDTIFSKWNYPYQLLETPLKQPKEQIEVHLYNFPFLPKLYHLFFDKLANYLPVYYYQFSPCQEFWSDTVTDFEKMRLLERDQQLSLYLDEGHPLLSNLGKMGRETFRVFEEEDFILDEHYKRSSHSTYLSQLQNDILNFKNTETEKDASILLLPAPSKIREVEILFSKLLDLNVKPSDIQVFAPDISSYAPLIELVFNAEESPFDFTIHDLPESPLLQTFFDILSLDRFKPDALFKLFSSPYFSPVSEKEVKAFKSWIDQTGVKWGVDAKHRKTLLPDLLDESESGTWKEVFEALLTNLIFIPDKPTDWDLPYLNFSDAEILGKGMTLVESLRDDLDFLRSALLTGAEWADHLLILFNRYLTSEEENFASFQEKLLLLKELEGAFSFPSIKRYLSNCLKQKRGVRLTKNLESMTFRSIRPGVIRSSKVVALLGLNEGAYPRSYVPSSLNLLGKESDYCPIPPEEDRYLFLELLTSAQDNLFITYQNISEEDGKEQPPSILVQELNPEVETHPSFPFHHHYFSTSKTYPMRHYEAARTYYEHQEKLPFIPEYLHAKPLPIPQTKPSVTLQELSRFAKNPIRFYFNHTLNLFLHYDETTDEEFFLSPLQRYKLLQQEESIVAAAERGQLPLGRFKEIAERKIKTEWEGVIIFETHPYPLKSFEGSLEITEEGFPFLGTPKLDDLIKIYPLYLALCAENPMPLLPLKGGEPLHLKSDPQKALDDYLNYYQVSCETPSPLIPFLATTLLQKDSSALASRIKNSPADPYLKNLFASPNSYDPQVIFDTWAPLLRKTFQPLLEMIV